MKKIFFFASAMLICAVANAQVIEGTVGNGNYADCGGQISAAYGLDFNNDGTLEFKLDSAEIYSYSYAYAKASYCYVDANSSNVVSNVSTPNIFSYLNLGDTINAASGFNGQGDCSVSSLFADEKYVGFCIAYPDGMHYGYAKINFHALNVEYKIYYKATAGAPIVVGELPTPVENVMGDKAVEVKKYMTNDGKLYIEHNGISYDAQGRVVRR